MPRKVKHRKVLTIVFIVVIVAAAGALGYWYFFLRPASVSRPSTAVVGDVATVADTAQDYALKGDTQSGLASYDTAINSATDSTAKVSLMASKVDYLITAKKLPEAITAAKQIVAIAPDQSVGHATLARAYEANGAKSDAITEYQKALQLLPAKTSDAPATRVDLRAMYTARIDELRNK